MKKVKKRQFVQVNFPQQKEQYLDGRNIPEQNTIEESVLSVPTETSRSMASPHDVAVFPPWQIPPDQSVVTSRPTMLAKPQTFQSVGFAPHLASQPLPPVHRLAASPSQPLQMSPVQMSPVAMPGMPAISPQSPQTRGEEAPPLYTRWLAQAAPGRKKRRIPIWGKAVLTMLVLLLLVVGGAGSYYYYVFSNALNGVTGQQLNRASDDQPDPGHQANNGAILNGGRFNILLLGSDTDTKTLTVNGGALAQVDIVVTIDPASRTVGMLSIPRDSWVHVPGYGMRKLDQAYLLGGGGKGGVELTGRTIHQDFGIYIDHYAWVGLDGFIKVIDTVGGVDVDVIHPVTDDTYPDDIGDHGKDIYAVKRLYIASGPQHLNGQQALEYVRSRHADLNGDFGRSARQQQVLNQLKTKLNNPGIIGKLPELANDLKGYLMTDLNLPDVVTLMNFARSLDSTKIKRVTLGPPYSETKSIDTDIGIQSVVFLHCDQVLPIIAPMFGLGGSAKCDNGETITGQVASRGIAPVIRTLQSSPALSIVGDVSTVSNENIWQIISQLASTSAMSHMRDSGDPLAIHSLLDLLFLIVFESPLALQI